MTKPRRHRRTKAEPKIEQLELLKQFRRDWFERTPPADQFLKMQNEKGEDDDQ